MSAVSLKKKLFNRFSALGLCGLLLSGCFANLGREKLPPEPAFLALEPCQLEGEMAHTSIKIEAKYLGAAKPIATARNTFGRITRSVVPYTRETALFELHIENQSELPLSIEPQDIELKIANRVSLKPLSLDFFQAQWPTHAVSQEEHVLDQAQAMGHVIGSILMPHPLGPKKDRDGILPFKRFSLGQEDKLYLNLNTIRWGEQTLSQQFCWHLK